MTAQRDDRTLVLQPIDRLQQSNLPHDDIVIDLDDIEPEAALLAFRNGPDAGLVVELRGQRITVGRHESADIFLDDVTVSRNHAEIVREGSVYTARDLDSLNGTYVNSRRVEGVELRHQDDLQIGKFHFTFLTADRLGRS
jgi:pSer/pThr/pTyr-binding forkhead associated (FHA) protein